ncbi:hypothetical protein CC86DRAFT_458461 [Ophiobolus disseminans]|uniref:Heterokaryon incompatibility domain-containing protein n=1 Tax=Ophiobolus disseminans TaxID=1469910 RepID=A0A6A6ZNM5_9PLEO|nr:hypothetical protein CC86DRAFT_458461 [Ophiobolus disseminans]
MFCKAREVFALTGRSNYEYEPLPSESCIRLLNIEPAPATAMIRCSLRIVNLDDDPSYTALSYSWKKDYALDAMLDQLGHGLKYWMLYYKYKWRAISLLKDQVHPQDVISQKQWSKKAQRFSEGIKAMADEPDSKKMVIHCNGKPMRIHPNLFDALSRLRNGTPGDYWVDALCINQQDIDERNTQVQMMGKIYSLAKLVVVWLGVLPPFIHTGTARVIQLAKPHTDGTDPVDPTSLEAISRVVHETERTELLIALAYLLSRRWFRRLWIIQECCLARDTLFMLGDHEFGASTLTTTISYMTAFINGPLKSILQSIGQVVPLWENLMQNVPLLLGSNEAFRGGERWSLGTWILMVKGRKATDLRDAVFAGLSLVVPGDLRINRQLQLERTRLDSESSTASSPQLWESLHADYSTEISHVLLNFAACILTKYNWKSLFLTVLLWRAPPEYFKVAGLPLHKYPSWVPDPSAWTSESLQPSFMLKNKDCPLPLSHNMDDGPKISSDGSTLFLTGAEFDTVSSCSPVMALKIASYEFLLHLIQWIAHVVPTMYQPSGCKGMEALARILMSPHQETQQEAQQAEDEALLTGLSHLIHVSVHKILTKSNKKQSSSPMTPNDACPTDEEKTELKKAFENAKKQHPYVPWPTEISIAQSQMPEDQPSNGTDDINSQSTPNNPGGESSDPSDYKASAFLAQLMLSATPGIFFLSVFTTKKGYMGIGPTWLQEGHHIFLIRGGKAPYIFTHIDDVLRRRAGEMRNQLSTKVWRPWDKRTKALRAELEAVESRIGTKHGWQLVGEAYIEGVMRGEVGDEMRERVERISIL